MITCPLCKKAMTKNFMIFTTHISREHSHDQPDYKDLWNQAKKAEGGK